MITKKDRRNIIGALKIKRRRTPTMSGGSRFMVLWTDIRRIINSFTAEKDPKYEWINDNEIAKRNLARFVSEWEPEYGVARLEDYEAWLEEEGENPGSAGK